MVCFFDFHEIKESPKKTQKPVAASIDTPSPIRIAKSFKLQCWTSNYGWTKKNLRANRDSKQQIDNVGYQTKSLRVFDDSKKHRSGPENQGRNQTAHKLIMQTIKTGHGFRRLNVLLSRTSFLLRTWCYMAKREFRSDVSEDLTRESLIALSYTLPDTKNLSSTEVPKSSNTVNNVAESVNTDEKEEFRAGLISISYAESPDTKDSPVSPEKNKG
ncbi:hypothetical protein L1887_34251 [Cichorium endivia]|nr:hypothetical protein L1887_34251 [Cichorium endivia]